MVTSMRNRVVVLVVPATHQTEKEVSDTNKAESKELRMRRTRMSAIEAREQLDADLLELAWLMAQNGYRTAVDHVVLWAQREAPEGFQW